VICVQVSIAQPAGEHAGSRCLRIASGIGRLPRSITPSDRIRPCTAAGRHEPADDSYDWHGLLIAPFGSVLKDIPLALHEVLLFRDDAHGNAATGNAAVDAPAVDAECYARRCARTAFRRRTPDEYLLCSSKIACRAFKRPCA